MRSWYNAFLMQRRSQKIIKTDLTVELTRDVVPETAVLVSRALKTNFMRPWSWEARSWSWYLWSWSRSWRVGLEKFQDQLCTAPVRCTVQSYLELASSSPNATVKNILCNKQFKSVYVILWARCTVFQQPSPQWKQSLAMVASSSASEVTTIWRYTNVYIIIIIIFMRPHRARMTDDVLCDLVFAKCNAAL